jgi:hypothetical protein
VQQTAPLEVDTMFIARSRAGWVVVAGLAALLPLLPLRAQARTQSLDGVWSSLDSGLDSTVSVPSARREFAAIADAQRDRYLIFGGFGFQAPDPGGLFREVWTLSLDGIPAWNPLEISGASPGERHSPQWGYDPARQRLIVFGGYGHHYPGDPNAYLNDLWQLSLDGTPAWTELIPSGTGPTGRLAGASIYDPLRQRFVVFGGTVGASVDVWQLSLSGEPTWSILAADGAPPIAGYGMTTIYDPVRDRMLMFGGSTSDDYFGVHNQVWELTLSDSPDWRQLSPLGTPPSPRRTLTSLYDPLRDRMITFGGWDGMSNDTTSFLGDTWALSLSGELRWTQLLPDGDTPIGRDAMTAAYDAKHDRLVVFGGWSGTTMLGDTWFLDWGEASSAAVLMPSAQADPGVAHVHWGVQGATGTQAAVFRRQTGTPWSSIAMVQRGGSGDVSYEDHAVTPGGRYAYLVAVPSHQGEAFGGEVWVNIPTAVDVGPGSGLEFALQPVTPNPLVDRFTASFVLPVSGPARLDLHDLSGRQLLAREVGSLGPGRHQLDLGSGRDMAPGMYFLRLSQAGRVQSRRVMVSGRGGTTALAR